MTTKLISECFFVAEIAPFYYRNNRSTGQKSLRCFPVCKPDPDDGHKTKHVDGGFCGQPLKCQMRLANIYDRPMNINDYVFVAEIRPCDKPGISALETVNKADLMSKVRIPHEKEIGVREIYLGEVEKVKELSDEDNNYSSEDNELGVEITFNGRCLSWDYSWRSNRWIDAHHVVDIIVLTYSSPTEYTVVDHCSSSEFYLMSSHKRRTSDEEVIHDKVRAKKSRTTDQANKRQSGPSFVTMFPENFDFITGKRRAASHPGTDSELIEASHALSRMSESAMHAFEDFDGGDLPLPNFVPGTNTLVGFGYVPSALNPVNFANQALASSWNTIEGSSGDAIPVFHNFHENDGSSSRFILPPRQQTTWINETTNDSDSKEERDNFASYADDARVMFNSSSSLAAGNKRK